MCVAVQRQSNRFPLIERARLTHIIIARASLTYHGFTVLSRANATLALSTRRCRAVKPCSEEKVDKDLIYEWGSMAISVTEKKKEGGRGGSLSDAVKPGAGH